MQTHIGMKLFFLQEQVRDKDTLWTELFELSELFQFSMIFQLSEIF